eukprot:TRINITY_DN6_c0_g1_i3.p3 TRINITY_DN6_c0_g1~~TRINITY_DN6_c0_g1_i3.p3  ORF type:complete len:198 (+),score=88.14 TRINITY_DN6_c0_g1_i3:70-663(+)
MAGSMGHVVAGFLSLAVTVLLAVAMADGRSFVKAKHYELNIAAAGVWKDFLGHPWEESKNILHSCDDFTDQAKALVAFAFMTCVFSGLSVLCNLLGLQSGKGMFGLASVGLNAVNFVFLVISIGLAGSLYEETFCGTITLSDGYDLVYALPFLVVAAVVSLLNLGALFAMGATKDVAAPTQGATEPTAEEVAPKEAA